MFSAPRNVWVFTPAPGANNARLGNARCTSVGLAKLSGPRMTQIRPVRIRPIPTVTTMMLIASDHSFLNVPSP